MSGGGAKRKGIIGGRVGSWRGLEVSVLGLLSLELGSMEDGKKLYG